jgi:hypothetical protein
MPTFRLIPVLPFLSTLVTGLSAQAPLSSGNLVVVSVNSSAITSAVTLEEYAYTAGTTPTASLVQAIPLPTSASGSNRAFAIRGNASSEGYLSLAQNGQRLLIAGYDAAPGASGSSIEASPAASIARVIAIVDVAGTIDTSTALVDAYDGSATTAGNFRAVASLDGVSGFWLSGTGVGASAGVRYVAGFGQTNSTQLNAGAPGNCRVVGIYNGQLYTSSGSTVYLGVNTVGVGLPTTSGQTVALLPGFPTTGGTAAGSTYDYFWADPNTVYVADDNSPASTVGGISKWTFNGSLWTRAYRLTVSLTPTSNWGARGLTGFTRNGVTTLWATMNDNANGTTHLASVVDTGSTAVVNVLATAPTGTAFRGIRYLAKPTTAVRFAAACGGSAALELVGNAERGTDVRSTITSPTAIPLLVYGSSILGLPIDPGCSCLLGPSLDIVVVGTTNALAIPDDPALVGITLATQGIDLLASGVCSSPLPFAVTDYYAFTIQ